MYSVGENLAERKCRAYPAERLHIAVYCTIFYTFCKENNRISQQNNTNIACYLKQMQCLQFRQADLFYDSHYIYTPRPYSSRP